MNNPPPDFNHPDTCVRLSPGTQVTFDTEGYVTLHHDQGDKDIRIQPDILLILYPLAKWTTVGALCKDWPESDQRLIRQHLDMMYQSGVVITSEAQWDAALNPAKGSPIDNGIIINVENHHGMLQDSIRMACYRRAIEKAVTPESVVLDLGSGTGILSFFAAKAGAKKIYAVEKRPDIARLSAGLAQANGFSDRITLISRRSDEIMPDQLNPKPTVFVSEILGDAVLSESILEYTIDARDRLLAPGATLIPSGLEIWLAGFDAGETNDRGQEVDELEAIYGLNFQLLKTVLNQKSYMRLERFRPASVPMISDPVRVIALDFATITESHFHAQFDLPVKQDGFLNGFCVYFKAQMDAQTVLTNSPWAPPTHWMQAVFYFPQRRAVKKGERLKMALSYKDGLGLWFSDTLQGA